MKMHSFDAEIQNIIKTLADNLNKYEKIFLINDIEHEKLPLTKLIDDYLQRKRETDRILILSSAISAYDERLCNVRKISKEEEQVLIFLYRTYDFSDRFFLIDKNIHYGNIFNYVEKGLLTLEEAMEAMLDL